MTDHFGDALAFTLRWEGVYSMDPDDPGGETFRGISRRANPGWSGWVQVDALADKKREYPAPLELAVHAFYREQYWDKVGGDQVAQIAPNLARAVFDWAVNSGVERALKILQGLVGAEQDGVFGPGTLASVRRYMDRAATFDLLERRESFYAGLVERRPELKKYINGWMNRVGDLRLLTSA